RSPSELVMPPLRELRGESRRAVVVHPVRRGEAPNNLSPWQLPGNSPAQPFNRSENGCARRGSPDPPVLGTSPTRTCPLRRNLISSDERRTTIASPNAIFNSYCHALDRPKPCHGRACRVDVGAKSVNSAIKNRLSQEKQNAASPVRNNNVDRQSAVKNYKC